MNSEHAGYKESNAKAPREQITRGLVLPEYYLRMNYRTVSSGCAVPESLAGATFLR